MDRYDERQIDERDYDEIDPEARRQAERVMRKRDRERLRRAGRRLPAALMDDTESGTLVCVSMLNDSVLIWRCNTV